MAFKATSRRNLVSAILWLLVGAGTLVTGRVSRWSYPEMTFRGSSAIALAVVCMVVGSVYLFGSFRRQSTIENNENEK